MNRVVINETRGLSVETSPSEKYVWIIGGRKKLVGFIVRRLAKGFIVNINGHELYFDRAEVEEIH